MKKKKGFTLVELLVVIAILAILVTVSVVGYMGFTKKAKESNDISLTTQMNTVLQGNQALEGKNQTAYDAFMDLKESGIIVEDLVPLSDGATYVWDSVNDRMVLLGSDNSIIASEENVSTDSTKMYKIVKSESELNSNLVPLSINSENESSHTPMNSVRSKLASLTGNTFSMYLASNINLSKVVLTKLVGLDVGENENIQIEMTSAVEASDNSITIRTNGGSLILSASVTVTHYGTSSSVKVNGTTLKTNAVIEGSIEVTKGNIQIENKASVSSVVINSDSLTDIKVNVSSTATLNEISATDPTVVEEIKSSSNISVPSQIKQNPAESDTEKNELFAGGIGTQKSPYLIETAEQFYNLNTIFVDNTINPYYFKQMNDITIKNTIRYFSGVYDGGNNSIYPAESAGFNSITPLFKNVYGDNTILENLDLYSREGVALNLVHTTDWDIYTNLTIQNVNTRMVAGCENVKVNSSNSGMFIIDALYSSIAKPYEIKLINCSNYVALTNTGTCTGAFVGSGPYQTADKNTGKTYLKVYFDNCSNYADIRGTENVGLFYGNGSYIKGQAADPIGAPKFSVEDLIVTNCRNDGNLISSGEKSECAYFPYFLEAEELYSSKVIGLGGTYNNSYYKDKEISIYQEGTDFSLTITNGKPDVTYKLGIVIGTVVIDSAGFVSNSVRYLTPLTLCDSSESSVVNKNKMHAYDYNTAIAKGIITSSTVLNYEINGPYAIALTVVGDTTYLIFKNSVGFLSVDSSISKLVVYAYDASGNLIGSTTA